MRRPEIIVYVPSGTDPATAGIARGSAIVGRPTAASDTVRIYFEGAVLGQAGMRTLADRAVHACGRLLDRYPTVAMREVPRESLVAVGTFDSRGGRIILAGDLSARLTADWLGTVSLEPSELRRSTL